MADDQVLETYLADAHPNAAEMVRILDATIREANPGFDVARKYGLLMYAINGDWGHWVCAVDAHPTATVGLRFLFGVMLSDPKKVLRAGSSVMMTWDMKRGEPVDTATVKAYVTEAVAKYPEYLATQDTILQAARNRARPSGLGR